MPYQLHCWPVTGATEELATELFELDDGAMLDTTLELATELFELDVVATELDVVAVELDVAAEQTEPVIVGFSETAPFLSPCTPKLTDWPG